MVSVRPLRADVGGNALPRKYWAWHMLRLLPLRRPLPLLLCWLRQQAQSFVQVREREREREQAGRDGHAPRDLKPPSLLFFNVTRCAQQKPATIKWVLHIAARTSHHQLRLSQLFRSHTHTERYAGTGLLFQTARSLMDISNSAEKDLGRELRLSNWFEGGKRERWEEWSTTGDAEPINRSCPLKRSP